MNILESKRLIFRLMDYGDTDALFEIWGDADTMRFCGGTLQKERIKQIIDYDREAYGKHGNAVFAVVLKEGGELIGICGGKLDEADPYKVEVIVHLKKQAWGKGYASEAVCAYIEWLKANNKATYICASAHPDNAASINMLKTCGFVQNGFVKFEDTGFVDEPFFELKL